MQNCSTRFFSSVLRLCLPFLFPFSLQIVIWCAQFYVNHRSHSPCVFDDEYAAIVYLQNGMKRSQGNPIKPKTKQKEGEKNEEKLEK